MFVLEITNIAHGSDRGGSAPVRNLAGLKLEKRVRQQLGDIEAKAINKGLNTNCRFRSMEVVAVVSGVVIALGGWIVTQSQARRAVRRNMRINYLLDAYRSLERVSNRPMSTNEERSLELAIADVQLLGSPSQIRLAQSFSTDFAADREGDIGSLLEDLRRTLRHELLLEPTDEKRVLLRISRDGGSAEQQAKIWQEAEQLAEQAIRATASESRSSHNTHETFVAEMQQLAASSSPIAAMEVSFQRVERELRTMVEAATTENVSRMNSSQLAIRALELGLIDAKLADGITGLGVMRLLAIPDQEKIEVKQAIEFVVLCVGVLFALTRIFHEGLLTTG